jgi:hypothetical protein
LLETSALKEGVHVAGREQTPGKKETHTEKEGLASAALRRRGMVKHR